MPQSVLAAPRELVGHIRRHRPHASPAPEPSGNASRKVIVAPIAACVLFAAIFIAANPVLEHYASELGDQVLHWFKRLLDIISFSRLLSWLGWLLVFAALLRPVVHSWLAGYLRGIPESLERVPGGVADGEDFPAAVATLAALNILFLAYNAMDSVYLYFKAGLPAGISYSDYSHRGCFWLAVALALSTLVIGFIFRGDLNWHPKRRRVSGLSYVWAAQNGLLAVGALRRLQIYIDYNGLTRMRIIGIYGVLLVVVGLALMVWKVRRTRSFVWLVRRDLLALWIAVIVLALTPRDLICCTFNVARVMAGNPRPLTLLHGQPISPAGLPALIPLLDYAGDGQTESDALAPLVRDGVAGLLGRELVQLRKARDGRWSQYQGAGAWALAELEDVSDQLDTTARDGRGKAEEAMRAHTRRWW